MNLIRFILFPFSIIFGAIVAVRNWAFRKKIMRAVQFDVPIVCIGNLSTGGTGKTPHTELLIENLNEEFNIGVLSRGYKRLTKGFVRADEKSNWQDVGDEPLQYYFKYGNKISVQVAEQRIHGVIRIMGDLPNTDLILLDDAFQHRSLKAGYNILLTDYSKPFFKDFILPVGNLREFRAGKNRANSIIVTKCPKGLSENQKKEISNKIKPNKDQKVFFSSINYKGIFNLDGTELKDVPQNVLLITGIANPNPILKYLGNQNVEHLNYPDHYRFKDRDIKKITDLFDTFASENKIILTTVKDLMRLRIFKDFIDKYGKEIHYLDISIDMENKEELLQDIKKYAKQDKGDS